VIVARSIDQLPVASARRRPLDVLAAVGAGGAVELERRRRDRRAVAHAQPAGQLDRERHRRAQHELGAVERPDVERVDADQAPGAHGDEIAGDAVDGDVAVEHVEPEHRLVELGVEVDRRHRVDAGADRARRPRAEIVVEAEVARPRDARAPPGQTRAPPVLGEPADVVDHERQRLGEAVAAVDHVGADEPEAAQLVDLRDGPRADRERVRVGGGGRERDRRRRGERDEREPARASRHRRRR
jgi:hypothetical protein